MTIQLGRHFGKSIELLVLKEGGYMHCLLLENNSSSHMALVQREACRLIRIFDAKPFIVGCSENCGRVARRVTTYSGSADLRCWCDKCDPGDGYGKIVAVNSYADAMRHAYFTCNGRRENISRIILNLARAKGLPDRVGETEAWNFFTATMGNESDRCPTPPESN